MITKNGALVISLDFELVWGVRDLGKNSRSDKLILTRQVVPVLLDLFSKYGVHATWATVGFLFFESRDALLADLPASPPKYSNKSLSPYDSLAMELGANENEDPLHYAPSLIHRILSVPHQELATHTFSHYYCLEDGQSPADFESDLKSAIRVAENYNCKIKSIVFPRNQYGDPYLDVCAKNDILAFRGNESVWFRRTSKREAHRQWLRRLMRLLDAYINISGTNAYPLPAKTEALPVNIPASRYLRSYSRRFRIFEPLRLNRVLSSMKAAAQTGQIFHLWWHPEDFSSNMDENLLFLEKILIKYKELNQLYGMQSLTMAEVSRQVLDGK
jgi:hypothetical protein